MRVLSPRYTVYGWAYSRPENLEKVNLLDEKEVAAAFHRFEPHIIVHVAAERWPDAMEKNRWPDAMEKNREQAWALNVEVTENLAKLALSENVFFLFLSTDEGIASVLQPFR